VYTAGLVCYSSGDKEHIRQDVGVMCVLMDTYITVLEVKTLIN
jgi:hypothetical protein